MQPVSYQRLSGYPEKENKRTANDAALDLGKVVQAEEAGTKKPRAKPRAIQQVVDPVRPPGGYIYVNAGWQMRPARGADKAGEPSFSDQVSDD